MNVSVIIDEKSKVPKYKQVVDSIVNDVSSGKLKLGDKLPSINELSEAIYLSRDTVEKAYKNLKNRKIIISVKGKGCYVSKNELISKINVFFLINKLSSYKMKIYNSFVKSLEGLGHVSLFIYHCDESLFVNLINQNVGGFNYYVIMPHFKTDKLDHISLTKEALTVMDKIPNDKIIVLDNKVDKKNAFSEVYQDFENDIYEALKKGVNKILKFDKINLVFPINTFYPYPRRILHGFKKFCFEYSLNFEILSEISENMDIKKSEIFIVIEENDLVNLVKLKRDNNLVLGVDIGIISYNDTPLKELLGITVVSTDFKQMGETAAELILSKKHDKIKNPFKFIDREST
ncbi:GntR family transcriptional regulator [Aureibaculum sp. A20]|uniref:GntR family transcriptional regulator n=1 Tax=Aureibaculum flavum TaxID=2795986 RepID=A0ABS0WNH8_9FLAO|nr:GntR family transcriptional regulator [Aureibaculum flavum]MBJ2173533.1 GntR family transcriptional regulator [Aureibaculum flavum]